MSINEAAEETSLATIYDPFEHDEDSIIKIDSTEPRKQKPLSIIGFNPFELPALTTSLNEVKSMTGTANSQGQRKSMFTPDGKHQELDENDDPPLMEDLGIDMSKVKQRLITVLTVGHPDESMLEDPDLAGPIAIGLSLGFLLLLSGKVHFGDIYAMFIIGNFLSYLLINLTSKCEIIPLYNVMSMLGYGLLPMLILGCIGIIFGLKNPLGIIGSISVAGWSSVAAGNMVNVLQRQSISNRILIIYPLFLFYLSFAMIVIF